MSQIKTTTLVGAVVVLALIGGLVVAFSANQEQQKLLSITNFDECVAAGNPVMPARRSPASPAGRLGAGGESYPEQCVTPDGRTFVNERPSVPNDGMTSNGCAVAGCSGQLCVSADEARDVVTTCEFRAEYVCYKEASCEPQVDGKCGWTETPELKRCLADPPSSDTDIPPVF